VSDIEQCWVEFWRLYNAGKWEPETHALLKEVLKPGDLFVDIGAWIGPVSLWALELGASVVAVEPDPVALEELERQLSPYTLTCEIHAGALAPHDGQLSISPCPVYRGRPGQMGDSMTRVTEEGLSAPCWTIETILAGRTPALAKMDVEGYELVLLPTVAPYLAALGTTLMVALHTELPDPAWFAGYGSVDMPTSARNKQGRSLSLLARP